MELKNNIQAIDARDQKTWRQWLEKNPEKEKSVWLIIDRKESEMPGVYYPEAVDEALSSGRVDSKPNKRDRSGPAQHSKPAGTKPKQHETHPSTGTCKVQQKHYY